ncbi:hypothetical protein AHAS_Ahas16G0031800 [Arachis hypogaea]
MPDNPPRNRGHRRAHSKILTLPDDISFDSDLGVVGGADVAPFSDDTEEDLLSMYLDMDKFNSSSATSTFQMGEPSNAAAASGLALTSGPASGGPTSSAENSVLGNNERPRVRHQHSQSMDGSTTIKPEMLVSGSEYISAADSKKAMSAAKLAQLALIDPKRAKRSPVDYCDAGAAVSEDYISGLQRASKGIYNNDGSLRYSTTKHYNGSEGDCFYVVGSGEFEVLATQEEKDGEVTKVLQHYTSEKLSCFGELALM